MRGAHVWTIATVVVLESLDLRFQELSLSYVGWYSSFSSTGLAALLHGLLHPHRTSTEPGLILASSLCGVNSTSLPAVSISIWLP